MVYSSTPPLPLMKFLCDNCKAKYQIPDEKIRGRTLKMKCRKCEHPIVIRGPRTEEPARASASKPAPSRSRGASVPRRAPYSAPRPSGRSTAPASSAASALGAEFRRGGSLAPEAAPQRPTVEWYVAINDVPVGPVKRDELARKIGTGAVHGKSLCWREGFDDWRPLGEVAELSSLLAQRRIPTPPPRPAPDVRPPPRPPPRIAPARETSNVVPIGGRMGAAAADTFDSEDEKTVMTEAPAAIIEQLRRESLSPSSPDLSPLPIGDPTGASAPSPSVIPAASSTPSMRPSAAPMSMTPSLSDAAPVDLGYSRRRGVHPAFWLAGIGVAAFSGVVGLAFVSKFLEDKPAEVASNEVMEEEAVDPDLEFDVDEPDPNDVDTDEMAEEGEEPTGESGDDESAGSTTRTTTRRTTMTPTTTASTMELTAQQRALLDRYGGTGVADPNISALSMSTTTTSNRPQLDGAAVRRVVNAATNKRALQRCYETAIRGAADPPRLRIEISVSVGASGTVTRVSAVGEDFNGLRACLERTVRRWRFPASSSGGETKFPFVFSPAG